MLPQELPPGCSYAEGKKADEDSFLGRFFGMNEKTKLKHFEVIREKSDVARAMFAGFNQLAIQGDIFPSLFTQIDSETNYEYRVLLARAMQRIKTGEMVVLPDVAIGAKLSPKLPFTLSDPSPLEGATNLDYHESLPLSFGHPYEILPEVIHGFKTVMSNREASGQFIGIVINTSSDLYDLMKVKVDDQIHITLNLKNDTKESLFMQEAFNVYQCLIDAEKKFMRRERAGLDNNILLNQSQIDRALGWVWFGNK